MCNTVKQIPIFGYGEDALTLWALKDGKSLGDIVKACNCEHENLVNIFYRPSLGRGTYGIGEFDFMIQLEDTIILGESKWVTPKTGSKEFKKGNKEIVLDDVQIKRHEKFKTMCKEYFQNKKKLVILELEEKGIKKEIKKHSVLHDNITKILSYYNKKPTIINCILLFNLQQEPIKSITTNGDFESVVINLNNTNNGAGFIKLT